MLHHSCSTINPRLRPAIRRNEQLIGRFRKVGRFLVAAQVFDQLESLGLKGVNKLLGCMKA